MIPSPCVGSCRLDPAAQLCGGCGRSGTEIATWKDADPASRARTWADLPRRRAALGIALHRLGWTPGDALDFAASTLLGGRGAWEVGPPGASVRLALGADVAWSVDRGAGTITFDRHGTTICLALTERVRGLALPAPTASGAERIVLAVPRANSAPRPEAGLTPLGLDRDAIRPADRGARLYDLGLGAGPGRVCLRTGDRDLIAALDRRAGQPGVDLLHDLASRLADAPPTLVVANPLARAEVGAADWRHRLDLDLLALGREAPPGVDLPEGFLPCARFDPTPGIPQRARSTCPTPAPVAEED